MNEVEKLARVYQIGNEKNALKEQVSELMKPVLELQEKLKELEKEEKKLRDELGSEAIKANKSLSFPGLGTVVYTSKETLEIVDEQKAMNLITEQPYYMAAQNITINKKKFLELVEETFKATGAMVDCVAKIKRESYQIRFAKELSES